ncbi:ATP-NAD kinase family protein [Haladaptatus sp. DYSN1]|uniref:ATP-NAD kinase family protein n=1 Tax=unclassified Haladaptatus TaxID=2622732 RepID=UPI002404969D|nr:ATP-NAD kinase family protein [Haladaptatus sp. DYSN1]
MRRIGVVANPIAGMGGRVGLKGTDGAVEQARDLGAEPRSPARARDALESLAKHAPDATILTVSGEMGEAAARAAGFTPELVSDAPTDTTAADTREAVRRFVEADVDLVLFAGGDGTAVDVAETLAELDAETPILGIPTGVKIYSAVFAVSPSAAGRIAATFDRVESSEVMDLDEAAYRDGEVRAELKGVVNVPVADDRQSSKQLSSGTIETLVDGFVADIDPAVPYVLGPGSTVGAIKDALGFDGSPLGVDVWRDGEVLVTDGNEAQILDALGAQNRIVVSPIGGQGFIFGRGNHQLSPAVIRQCDVDVVGSRAKIDDIGVLRVDTGDSALDEELKGWYRVRVGRFEHRMLKAV